MAKTRANSAYDGDLYKFTFNQAGAVTTVAEVGRNGRLEYERIDRDESYSLQGDFVVKTEWDDGRAEWTVYADTNGDGFWKEVAEGYGAPNLAALSGVKAPANASFDVKLGADQYVFGFSAQGAVTAVYEVEANGRLDREDIDRDESYSLVGGFVLKTERDDGVTEWTVYADGNGDGRWSEIAEGKGPVDLAGVTSAFSGDFLALT